MIKVYKGYSAFYDKSNPQNFNSLHHFLNEEWNDFSEAQIQDCILHYQSKENWITAMTKMLEKQTAASKIGIAIWGTKVIQIV